MENPRFTVRAICVTSVILLCLVVTGLWLYSQPRKASQPVRDRQVVDLVVNEPIQPVPLHIKLDSKKVDLGKQLFDDARLSHDNSISCSSCHNLRTAGTDRLAKSIGINGGVGLMNAPTVLNSGFNFKQFWDGRADSLEDQIDGPTHESLEMGSDWTEITAKLKRDSHYVSVFADLYKADIASNTIKDAIATFERSLYTSSRFDRFLRGDSLAVTNEEKEGYRIFKVYGCISCHQGVNVGGNIFQKFGVIGDYFADRSSATKADLGRFNITHDERDRHVFKVPGLRNVALTPPYFHDGSAETLESAVAVMGKYQLGRKLSGEEIGLIVKFLKSLSSESVGEQP